MSKIIHCSLDIVGALKNMEGKRSTTKSFVQDDSGRFVTVGEARQFFYEELGKGRKVLPVGDCDNFDYQKGCLGHEEQESQDE